MNWYLAKIVFRIVCGEGKHTPQFDEQLRLICADDREAAVCKAQLIGKQEEDVFCNEKQQLVTWRFVNVTELYSLETKIDGAEISSRIIEIYNNEDLFEEEIHEKAGRLKIEYLIDY